MNEYLIVWYHRELKQFFNYTTYAGSKKEAMKNWEAQMYKHMYNINNAIILNIIYLGEAGGEN